MVAFRQGREYPSGFSWDSYRVIVGDDRSTVRLKDDDGAEKVFESWGMLSGFNGRQEAAVAMYVLDGDREQDGFSQLSQPVRIKAENTRDSTDLENAFDEEIERRVEAYT